MITQAITHDANGNGRQVDAPTPPPSWALLPPDCQPSPRRMAILERHGWTCAYCGKNLLQNLDSVVTATIDHVIPKAAKGGDGLNNLRPCCMPCNLLKGKTPTRSVEQARLVVLERRTLWITEFSRRCAQLSITFPREGRVEDAGGESAIGMTDLLAEHARAILRAVEVLQGLATTAPRLILPGEESEVARCTE